VIVVPANGDQPKPAVLEVIERCPVEGDSSVHVFPGQSAIRFSGVELVAPVDTPYSLVVREFLEFQTLHYLKVASMRLSEMARRRRSSIRLVRLTSRQAAKRERSMCRSPMTGSASCLRVVLFSPSFRASRLLSSYPPETCLESSD